MTNRKQFDIIAKESLRGYGSVGRAMRSQRIGQGFESPYLHQIKDTAQGVLCFGGDNAGQHTARFTAQGALVCNANLMSRIKVFASIICLNFNFLSYRQSKADRVRQVPRAKIKQNNREAYYAFRGCSVSPVHLFYALICFPRLPFQECFYRRKPVPASI